MLYEVITNVWIAFKDENEAKLWIEDIKAHIGDREIGIYKLQ